MRLVGVAFRMLLFGGERMSDKNNNQVAAGARLDRAWARTRAEHYDDLERIFHGVGFLNLDDSTIAHVACGLLLAELNMRTAELLSTHLNIPKGKSMIDQSPLIKIGQGSYERTWPPASFIHEDADTYHAKAKGERGYLSSHMLGLFRKCPRLFRRKQLGLVPDKDTAAYAVGRAAHVLVLEGRERYES